MTDETNTERQVRRKWPDIKFDNFYYEGSGDADGPDDNETLIETVDWVTSIITETKVSIWPLITRIKITKSVLPTPKPTILQTASLQPLSSPQLSASRNFISETVSIENQPRTLSNSLDALSRSSIIYPGPSSLIIDSITTTEYGPIPEPKPEPTIPIYSISQISELSLNTIQLQSGLSSFDNSEILNPTQTLSDHLISPTYNVITTPIQSSISSKIITETDWSDRNVYLTPTVIRSTTLIIPTTITICPDGEGKNSQVKPKPEQQANISEDYLIRTSKPC